MEISHDLKKAYVFYADYPTFLGFLCGTLARGLRDMLGELLEAEFKAAHTRIGLGYCANCAHAQKDDPRHNWQRSDWQGEAERLLREDAKLDSR